MKIEIIIKFKKKYRKNGRHKYVEHGEINTP